jgi:pimeloyl-ACP methyl ester carboxylesterase
VKELSCDDIYRGVSAERSDQLQQFRAAHPYKRLIVGGVEWEYITCGQGTKALLVLGGGLTTGEASFKTILKMEGEYRVVSPSYPPVGKMAVLVDGLAAILNAEGVGRTHVFGHSLGAAIAHVFVRRHPEKVDKLVMSGFGLYNERNARRTKRALRLFELFPYWFVSGYYKRRMATLLSGIDAEERAFTLAYVNDLLDLQHSKRTLIGQFQLLGDIAENAYALGVFKPVKGAGKVLILQAKDDTGFEAEEQIALRTTYPGAQVHVFEEGGHLASITRREEYDAVMYGFLGGEAA